MNLWPLKVVAQKELVDGLRERRSIYAVAGTTLFGVAMIAFMLNQIATLGKAAERITVPVTGQQFAPVLVAWLQQQNGVTVTPGPADAERAVREHKADVVLVIRSGFAENFRQSKPAKVQIFSDSTRRSAQPQIARLRRLLQTFQSETGALRLIVRGIAPEVIAAIGVDEVDVSSAQQRAAAILNVMLMMVAMAVMTAGMQIATDSTAGERERHSLEPLLLNPVPRWQIIAGKWLASAIVAFGGMMLSLLLFSALLSKLPLEQAGIRFQLDGPKIALIIAAMGPLALLVPAIQAYLACFARSFKEAQSYTVFLVIPVASLAIVSMFYPVTAHRWLLAIPLLAQYALATDALAGRAAPSAVLAATTIEAVVVTATILWLAARRFSNERILL